MKAYKAFNKDMTCRGFQFEVGKVYETDTASLCNSGFHACENPLDVLNYYDLTDSAFAEVDLDATEEKHDQDSKRCGKRIEIKASLDLKGFIKASISFLFEQTKDVKIDSGYSSQLTASGKNSVVMIAGNNGKAKASIGSWITLAEWEYIDNEHTPIHVVTKKVDGVKIKADTWYELKKGKFREWKQ
jgi:hypothetical protein